MKNEKGFTLIELFIVVAIIGTLSLIAIPQFASYRTRGFDADAKSTLKLAAITQEAYYTDHKVYASEVTLSSLMTIKPEVDMDVSVLGDTYSMSTSHSSSNNRFEIQGPGGTINLMVFP